MALCWECAVAFLENSLRALVHGSLMDGWAEKGNNGLEIRTYDHFDRDSRGPGDSGGGPSRGHLQNQGVLEVHNPEDDLRNLVETCAGVGVEESLQPFH